MYYFPEDDMDRGHCHKDKKCKDNNNMPHEKHDEKPDDKKPNKKMKKYGTPMHQQPMGLMPMHHEHMNQMPIQQNPMNQMPIQNNPVNTMPWNTNMPNMHKVPKELLDMIVEAMKDELADRAKYKMMMEMTCSDKCRRQINFAYEDEGKHYKMFQFIYRQLTGQDMEVPAPKIRKPDSLKAAIESSVDGELEAVEFYRRIYAMLPNRQLRDMVYEIITDEQEHATRFVFLCGCNKC